METGRIFEMLWDCRYCGTRKLLARSQRYCPQCGSPQDPATRHFPADDEKVEGGGYRYEGADKVCRGCQSPNGMLAQFCGQCGAPLTDATPVQPVADEIRSTEAKFAASLSRRKLDEAERRDLTGLVSGKPGTSPSLVWLKWLLLAMVVLVLSVLFWTRQATVQVTEHYWRQEIGIERFGPVAESAWCSQLPPGAYDVMSRSEVRSYRRVPDGQDCRVRRVDRGDGTYRESTECLPRYTSEPIYDLRCDYRIDRWRPISAAVAEGHDQSPRWPETGIISNRACRGCEREGARGGRYELILKDGGRQQTYRCPVAQELWRHARDGTRWRLTVGVIDGQARCASLQPAGLETNDF